MSLHLEYEKQTKPSPAGQMDEYIYKECRTGDEKRVEISYFKKRKERLNQVIIKLMDDEYRSWLATPGGST